MFDEFVDQFLYENIGFISDDALSSTPPSLLGDCGSKCESECRLSFSIIDDKLLEFLPGTHPQKIGQFLLRRFTTCRISLRYIAIIRTCFNVKLSQVYFRVRRIPATGPFSSSGIGFLL